MVLIIFARTHNVRAFCVRTFRVQIAIAHVRCVRNARTFRECAYLCVREQKQKKVKKCSISRKLSKICYIFAPDFETYQL